MPSKSQKLIVGALQGAKQITSLRKKKQFY